MVACPRRKPKEGAFQKSTIDNPTFSQRSQEMELAQIRRVIVRWHSDVFLIGALFHFWTTVGTRSNGDSHIARRGNGSDDLKLWQRASPRLTTAVRNVG